MRRSLRPRSVSYTHLLSLVLIAMLGAKIALFPDMIRDDLHNSIMASVSATLFMTLMQLSLIHI